MFCQPPIVRNYCVNQPAHFPVYKRIFAMNKTLFTALQAVVMWLLVLFNTPLHAHNITEEHLAQRVESLHSVIDMRYTDEVGDVIKQYTVTHPNVSQRLLGLSISYFPLIENMLKEQGMPDELKYLAVIESGLRPDARSVVGATGMWQFMHGTARMYGLKINTQVDERQDVVKSTQTAIIYLHDLYQRFGDWTLAIAAYNCGPGKISSLLKRYGGTTYWDIQSKLPRETQRYVPKFIGMQYLMSYYHMHDLVPDFPDQEMRYLSCVKVYEKLNLREISLQSGVSLDLIKALNPVYKKGIVPASTSGNTVILPEDGLYSFLTHQGRSFEDIVYRRVVEEPIKMQVAVQDRSIRNLKKLPSLSAEELNTIQDSTPFENHSANFIPVSLATYTRKTHKISKGETLASIALQYGLTKNKLLELNDIVNASDLFVGMDLVLE